MTERATADVPAKGRWEHFPHQADVGVRGYGSSLAAAFEQVARAMTAVITDPACVAPRTAVRVECRAEDSELLLFDWLNTLIYEMATRHMLFSGFEVDIATDSERLHAVARGEKVDAMRHQPRVEVKGATFTELRVSEDAQGEWCAQCVLDV
jgi:tRNA nucleotidyltransferase (CCA-adding enzyme)